MFMIKVIVSATNKGGEGKTTTTINLAEYLALVKNKRVLCIDLDPQANLSNRYIEMDVDPDSLEGKVPPNNPDLQGENKTISSIADIFFGENVCPYKTNFKNLELMPSHSEKLQQIENATDPKMIENIYQNFKTFVQMPELEEYYDVILIDTPPAKGPLTKSAIKAATHLIIPAQMEQFSIEGIYGMLHLFRKEAYMRDSSNELKLIGILPNQIRDVVLHKNFLDDLKSTDLIKEHIIPYSLKKRTIYSEMLVEGANPKSIFEINKNKKERQEMEEVCGYCTAEIFS